MFKPDVDGKRNARLVTSILFSAPVIGWWTRSITIFLTTSNAPCFSGIDILSFSLLPIISLVVYLRAGDRISVNTFRTIGYLWASTWISLMVAFVVALAIANLTSEISLSQLRGKMPELLFEAVFFSIFSFASAGFGMEAIRSKTE